jgi:pyruvate formate lyase activating enzyme
MSIAKRTEIEPGIVRGDFWHRLPDGRFQCDLCPRYCKLRPGQRAFCFVRQADAEGVLLTSYGRASGFCVDPIEKKPLNHFYPGSPVLSFGTAGCNLGCRFCQNWDISKAREIDRLGAYSPPETIADVAAQTGCRSVAFTYNDPIIFAEYAIDCAAAVRERGLSPVAVTAGYVTDRAREAFFPRMDAVNVDLKAFTDDFYDKLCFAQLGPVLDTLRYVHAETTTWLEVTTLLIPGHNDSDAEVAALCEWFIDALGPDVPLHFTAFHPDFKLTDVPATPHATLTRARDHAKRTGLHHVYTGNTHDPAGQSTYCSACGVMLVERDWYKLGRYAITEDGRCAACGLTVPGRFADRPGTWGAKRMPLRVL